jgi:SET domain-containing protein
VPVIKKRTGNKGYLIIGHRAIRDIPEGEELLVAYGKRRIK